MCRRKGLLGHRQGLMHEMATVVAITHVGFYGRNDKWKNRKHVGTLIRG